MRDGEALALGAAVGAGLYLLSPRRAAGAPSTQASGSTATSAASPISPTAVQPVLVTTGDPHFDRRGARLVASIPQRAERTRTLIAQWSTYLDRYRGGLPRGVFAAVMQMESDGSPGSKGDDSLGEVGLFQITESFPRSLGLDPQLRHRNEWNFYFAGTEYNQAAWRWHRRHPDEIARGSREAWLLARLSFAIGDGGARSHVQRALAAEPQLALREGAYAALLTFIRKGGARRAGSQSAAKVAYRIAVAVPTNFEIGEMAEAGDYGAPARLSPPTT